MRNNLINVFGGSNFHSNGLLGWGNGIISAVLKCNKHTGAQTVRVSTNKGVTYFQTVTKTGVTVNKAVILPEITSVAQRNAIICDLNKNGELQENIAACLNISQPTVSNVLRREV